MEATITKQQQEMMEALIGVIKDLNQKLLFAETEASKEQIEDDISYMMKMQCKYFTKICKDITTEELIKLQDDLMAQKYDKERMDQIEILEDIINERVTQK